MISALFVIVGLALLVAGGELLVRGATTLALRLRIRPGLVGLTVVAAGTSMPELVVSVGSALRGAPDLALGNVVGSNIYNIALILGLAALIRPLVVKGETVRLEWPIMMGASLLAFLLARDGSVDRLEGAVLSLLLVGSMAWLIYLARRVVEEEESQAIGEETRPLHSTWLALLALGVGVGLLVGGTELMVRGAVALADLAGLSQRVIGLTVVALGTSLPELVTSVVASLRGRDDIAIANLIGSNTFNLLGILGLTALVRPIPVGAGTLSLDAPLMLGVAALLLPLMWTGMRVNRLEGALLLALAFAYTGLLLLG